MALSRFHRVVSKSLWFVLFNVVSVGYLMLTGSLRKSWLSIGLNSAALLLINGIALRSTRKFPDWKWTRRQQQDWDQKGLPPVNQSSPDLKE
jgi:hypothetical protein